MLGFPRQPPRLAVAANPRFLMSRFQDGIDSGALRREARACRARHSGSKPIRRFLGIVVAASCVLAGAACSTRPDQGVMTLTSEVPVARAMIALPPGRLSAIAVLERRYRNAVFQEIALSTDSSVAGQNAFHVSATEDLAIRSEFDDVLRIRRPNLETVDTEMSERLPGIAMRTSPQAVQNRYGPFGYATGRSAEGDACLYAWQQIEADKPILFKPIGAVSIRLRLCDARATEAQLLRTMYAYTVPASLLPEGWSAHEVKAPANLEPVDLALPPLGKSAGGSSQTSAKARKALSTTGSRTGAAASAVEKDSPAPLPGYPAVPLPPAP